jgi:hypothetical protein
MTCLAGHGNEVRLALNLLAYNLGSLWRRLALSRPLADELAATVAEDWRRLVKHAPYYWRKDI